MKKSIEKRIEALEQTHTGGDLTDHWCLNFTVNTGKGPTTYLIHTETGERSDDPTLIELVRQRLLQSDVRPQIRLNITTANPTTTVGDNDE